MTNDEPNAVDRMLEEALSTYSSQEPLAGLEQRVLNRVHAECAPVRPRVWGRALVVSVSAGVVAASVAAMTFLAMRPVPDPPRAPTVIAQLPKPTPILVAAQPVSKPPASHASQQLPKSREFPRPTPVTSNERALLALLQRAPDATRDAFIDFENRSSRPIPVEEIKIEPLKNDGPQ
jgi:hypothetical protein